jgi:hypothetical protein
VLKQLKPEHLDLLHSLRAERYPVLECVSLLKSTYPESKDYHEVTWYKYFASEEGKRGVEEALGKLREEAQTQSYAHRGSRVHSLVEIAEGLLQKVRSFTKQEVGSRPYLAAVAEFRSLLRDIKAEVEVLGVGDSSALDIAANFLKLITEEKKIPAFVGRSLKQDSFPETN